MSNLPAFSASVLTYIKGYFAQHPYWVEEGFSDLTIADVAEAIGAEAKAVSGAVRHLAKEGLLDVEKWDTGHDVTYFLHIA
jgi:hypothetical protein